MLSAVNCGVMAGRAPTFGYRTPPLPPPPPPKPPELIQPKPIPPDTGLIITQRGVSSQGQYDAQWLSMFDYTLPNSSSPGQSGKATNLKNPQGHWLSVLNKMARNAAWIRPLGGAFVSPMLAYNALISPPRGLTPTEKKDYGLDLRRLLSPALDIGQGRSVRLQRFVSKLAEVEKISLEQARAVLSGFEANGWVASRATKGMPLDADRFVYLTPLGRSLALNWQRLQKGKALIRPPQKEMDTFFPQADAVSKVIPKAITDKQNQMAPTLKAIQAQKSLDQTLAWLKAPMSLPLTPNDGLPMMSPPEATFIPPSHMDVLAQCKRSWMSRTVSKTGLSVLAAAMIPASKLIDVFTRALDASSGGPTLFMDEWQGYAGKMKMKGKSLDNLMMWVERRTRLSGQPRKYKIQLRAVLQDMVEKGLLVFVDRRPTRNKERHSVQGRLDGVSMSGMEYALTPLGQFFLTVK